RGRLLSIDAKTHLKGGSGSRGPKKDITARLLQLQRSGGVPARFVVAVPYLREDVNERWFSESRRFLPLNLQNWGVEFCVIGADERDFWSERVGPKVEFSDTAAPGRTRCRTLESLLGAWSVG